MAPAPFLYVVLSWSVVIALAYLLAADLVVTVRCAVAPRRRLRDIAPEEQSALALSRFTIPVSLVVNVAADRVDLIPSIRALLELDYPLFEVIIVTDGAATSAVEKLRSEFDLVARQVFYRRSLPGPDVRAVYVSSVDSRLLVVDQPGSDGPAAWNCGVNVARYRYVGIVATGRFCRSDALLSAMAPANADPATVVAILGDLGEPERRATPRLAAGAAKPDSWRLWLSEFEQLGRLRERARHGVARPDLGDTLDNPDAFGLWRRDAIVEAGGFSGGGAGAGLDLALRLREATEGVGYRILTMSRCRNVRGDRTVRETIEDRARTFCALLEAAWRTRGVMLIDRRHARSDAFMSGVPGLLETWLLLALPTSALTGVLGWLSVTGIATVVAFGKGIATNAALLAEASAPSSDVRQPLRSICLGALEFPIYRPLGVIAALRGAWQFLTRRRPLRPVVHA